ncbi:hypothetical protein BCR35DRAFT_288241 [Leucosporidium creatinivorum]|uniref:Uncharacterized protein n=1 Tax=Leucosporidium creatinivorum TaxID=106004 RepID=A0A1Y2FY14_9BASI|nr:hypothetical protein BCR35DRAFT_288241 [Leucosporidium creatinivorum]
MGSSQSLPTSASAVSPSPSPTPTPEPAPPALRRRTFEQLVEEELPIQRASVAMEGGAPSCMTLFDDFFSCFSLGTQARSLYRHGHARDCTPKFSSFKFCMSIKSLSPEKREEVWIRRRAEWWARRRLEKSSEDVWEARRGVYQGQEGYREAQEEREREGK